MATRETTAYEPLEAKHPMVLVLDALMIQLQVIYIGQNTPAGSQVEDALPSHRCSVEREHHTWF